MIWQSNNRNKWSHIAYVGCMGIFSDRQPHRISQMNSQCDNVLRMKNPTWSQRLDCYEPGVTAIKEPSPKPYEFATST